MPPLIRPLMLRLKRLPPPLGAGVEGALQQAVVLSNRLRVNPDIPVELTGVTIENTTVCNSRCTMCPHGFGAFTRAAITMSQSRFEHVLAACRRDGVKTVNFSGMGESLCDPGFLAKALAVKRSGFSLGAVTTNAQRLTQQTAETLVDLGLQRLNVSIDAMDPAAYENTRIGLSFETVFTNTIGFLRHNRAAGNPVEVTVNAVVTGDVRSNIRAYQRAFADYRGPGLRLTFYPAHNWMGSLDDACADTAAPPLKTYCRRIFSSDAQIRVDGTVALCCLDYNNRCSLGPIDSSIALQWNGTLIRRIRRRHILGQWHALALCRDCSEIRFARPPVLEVR